MNVMASFVVMTFFVFIARFKTKTTFCLSQKRNTENATTLPLLHAALTKSAVVFYFYALVYSIYPPQLTHTNLFLILRLISLEK
jgi:hypothetical protein